MPGNRSTPTPAPASRVRGSPMRSRRLGQASSRRSARRSSRAASLNRRSTSATSVTRSATALSTGTSSRPSACVPTRNPAAVKTIAEVTPRRSSGPEKTPQRTMIATIVASAIILYPAREVRRRRGVTDRRRGLLRGGRGVGLPVTGRRVPEHARGLHLAVGVEADLDERRREDTAHGAEEDAAGRGGEQHDQRVQVQGRAQGELRDERLQEAVGDDHQNQHGDGRRGPAGAVGEQHGERAADDGAEVRYVVGQPGDDGDAGGQRHADDECADAEHGGVEHAGDGAPVDVAAEEARAVGEDPIGDGLRYRGDVLRRPASDLAPADEHPHADVDADEDAEEEAAHRTDHRADGAGRAARQALHEALHPRLERVDLVLGQARHRLLEGVHRRREVLLDGRHLVDEAAHDHEPDADGEDDGQGDDDQGAQPATEVVALEPVDDGQERAAQQHREERRQHEQPGSGEHGEDGHQYENDTDDDPAPVPHVPRPGWRREGAGRRALAAAFADWRRLCRTGLRREFCVHAASPPDAPSERCAMVAAR